MMMTQSQSQPHHAALYTHHLPQMHVLPGPTQQQQHAPSLHPSAGGVGGGGVGPMATQSHSLMSGAGGTTSGGGGGDTPSVVSSPSHQPQRRAQQQQHAAGNVNVNGLAP